MRHRLHRIVKGAVELILGVGMIAVPAGLTFAGASVPAEMLIGIWLILGLPLAILLITDIRAMYREEAERAEREAEEWRQYAEWTRSNGDGEEE